MVGIAQLVRALVCGTRGRQCESGYLPLLMLGSQIGKALDFDSSNCRFDPYPSSISPYYCSGRQVGLQILPER